VNGPVRGRYRWWIGALLLFSTVINYLDRQTFSVLGPHPKEEFRWSNESFALVIISFRIAYTVGQAVTGRWLDRWGTRDSLSIGVLWYSLAAIATSFATGLRSFCALRFLLGAGEAANWPGATKAVAEWFPRRERGWAVATFSYATLSTMALALPADLFQNRAVASVAGMAGAAAGAGTIVSTFFIGVVADRFSFKPILITASLVPLVAAGFVLLLVRNDRSSGRGLVKFV